MLTMQRFLSKLSLGIEITSQAVRSGALTKRNGVLGLLGSSAAPLAPGMVAEGFVGQMIRDRDGVAAALGTAVRQAGAGTVRRAGLGLPDAVFRVQLLDFDDLPAARADRERLIRWRLEKAASFDMAETTLRWQIIPREERRITVLAGIAKTATLAQVEDLLAGAGLETWTVGPSSFHVLNLYAPVIGARGIASYALVWITEGSYCTLVVERGSLRFYRFREIKPGVPDDVAKRLARELDDSLHFYTHMDRLQTVEVGHLFLAGDPAMVAALDEAVKQSVGIEAAVLDLSAVVPSAVADAALAPAIGAGGVL